MLRAGKKHPEKESYPLHGDGSDIATIPLPEKCLSTGQVMDSGLYRSVMTQRHSETLETLSQTSVVLISTRLSRKALGKANRADEHSSYSRINKEQL